MIRLAMVGAGVIAARHMDAFARMGDVQPQWVVTRRSEQAAEFGRHWRCRYSGTDLALALMDPDVDVVVIASPNHEHFSQAAATLTAGKHVIVEIPATLSLADALKLSETAERRQRRLFVCHTMRSFPAIRYIRERVLAGTLDVSGVSGFFAIPRRRNQSPNGTRSWVDDLLWHHGCHFVDAALWTLGVDRADTVSAIPGRTHPAHGMVTDLCIAFRTPARQVVSHFLTYNTEHPVAELRYSAGDSRLTYRDGSLFSADGNTVVAGPGELDLEAQNRAILRALELEEPSDYDITSVLPSMRILQEAENSNRSLGFGADAPEPACGIGGDPG